MKYALVTGASSGFGLASAEKFAAAGYNLILVARRLDRLKAVGEKIGKKHGVKIFVSQVDVRDRAQVDKFIKETADLLENTEILLNNAGLAKGTEKFMDGRIDDWEQMIDTNVKGLLYVTRAVIPFMLKNKRGHIVNLGSAAGRWTYPGGAVYCASKFAVRAISEGLRMDLLGTPIRVTNIEPGLAETEFSEVRLSDKERAKAVYKGMTPLSADDVSDAVLWCVQRPKHVNIQEMVIFPTDQAAIHMVHREDAAKPV